MILFFTWKQSDSCLSFLPAAAIPATVTLGGITFKWGSLLLMVMVFIFAFSTMFSYSYYGVKCTSYLCGAKNGKYYNYFFLVMLMVAAMIPLKSAVSLIDLAYALMAFPTMITLFVLAPKVKREMKEYLKK